MNSKNILKKQDKTKSRNATMLHVILILFSLLGLSATFMPWLYYPRSNAVFYGYMADGILTGAVFILILIFALYSFRKKRIKTVGGIIMAVLGLLMAVISYMKISAIELEKLNFNVDDPRIAAMSAGFHQGIGVYVFGIAGLGVFLTILAVLSLQKWTNPIRPATVPSKKNNKTIFKYITGIVLLIAVVSTILIIAKRRSPSVNTETLKAIFSADIAEMGKALANEDYAAFVEFIPPIMIQGYGGRDQTIEYLQMGLTDLKNEDTFFIEGSLEDILDVRKSGKHIQAVISQAVTMSKEGINTTEVQKMLAVSEDNGNTWHYMDISGKTDEEIRKFYPELIENLNF